MITESVFHEDKGRGIFALIVVLVLMLCACPGLAYANTNDAASAALNTIKTQAGFQPGKCNWQSWNNPKPAGWTNCKSGCWYFAANVATRMFGSCPSGTSGYTLTNPGNYSQVGQLVDTPSANPSYSGVQDLLKKAYPGDIIQFKGGPSGWGSWQHTAVVESVDGNGVRIYQHADNAHVTSTYYNWNYFYNTYLDFDRYTNYNKGITLYHAKNYDQKYPPKPVYPTPLTISNGVYVIRPVKDLQFCVDIDKGGQENFVNAALFQFACGTNQQFRFTRNNDDGSYTITCVSSGKALDVAGGGADNGTNVAQYAPNGTAAQRWFIEDAGNGRVSLRSKCSNKYLDVKGGSMQNGSNIQIWQSNNSDAQKFRLIEYVEFGALSTSLEDGYYQILSSVDDEYAVDVNAGSIVEKSNVQIEKRSKSESQVFHLTKDKYGRYTISSKVNDSLVFDLLGASLDNGANVALYHDLDGLNQRWILRDCGNGLYAFQNAYTGKYMDLYTGKVSDGGNIGQWIGNSSAAQKFRIVAWVDEFAANKEKADEAVSLINSIGVVTLDSKDAIDSARTAYNALTDDQKALVPAESLDTLEKAEAAYKQAVSEKQDQEAADAKAREDAKAADDVIAAIDDIGDVTSYSGDIIDKARTAYDSLTDDQKALVPAESLAALEDVEAAYAVVVAINGIGKVSLNSKSAIDAADEAYRDLTGRQKALIPDESLERLDLAKIDYQDLVKSEEDKSAHDGGSDQHSSDDASASGGDSGTASDTLITDPDSQTDEKPHPGVDVADGSDISDGIESGISPDNPLDIAVVESDITSSNNDDDQIGSAFGLLRAKGSAKSKSAVKISWKKVPGASAYVVYGNKCGKGNHFQKIKTVKGTSFTQKKLKKGTYYKYLVVALKGDAAIATSKTVHVATKGGKVGNDKSVKVAKKASKGKLTLKKGKTFKLKAKAVAQSKKLKVKKHRAIAYESSNPAIATLNKKGVVKAKAKGKCTVYAYAQDGVCKAVKVTVK